MILRWPDPTPTRTLTRAERDALYPADDDEPMTSSLLHWDALTYALAAVQDHLRYRDCLIAADFALYYQPVLPGEPGPGPSVVPDLLVAFDVTLERDTSYCLWEVGKMPELVMEMTSQSTKDRDRTHKPELYAALGVAEYWQYDPHDAYLQPRLQGWQLVRGIYQPIAGQRRSDLEAELFPSAVLGTAWGYLWETGDLRLWNPREDTWYLPQAEARQEAEAEAQAQAQARQEEAQARQEAEAEAQAQAQARQEEAQARQEAEAEAQAQAQARQEEAQARREAEAEIQAAVQRAQAAEAEVARLRALLADQTSGDQGK